MTRGLDNESSILCGTTRSVEFLDFAGARVGGKFVGVCSMVETCYDVFGGEVHIVDIC